MTSFLALGCILYGAALSWVRGAAAPVREVQLQAPVARAQYPNSFVGLASNPGPGPALYVIEDTPQTTSVQALQDAGFGNVLPASPLRRNGNTRGMALDPAGLMYLYDSKSKVHVLDRTGAYLRGFRAVRRPGSIAALATGEIVIGGPASSKLIHVFAPDGRLLRSFGDLEPFSSDRLVNAHLNEGLVFAEPAGGIVYVFKNAPEPSFLKFTAEGRRLSRHAIEGAAIELQVPVARRFLDRLMAARTERKACSVGSVDIVNGAAVDSQTGHLWIALNASTTTGQLYEYDANGVKLQEHRFVLPGAEISAVKNVAMARNGIYVQLPDSAIYRFDAPRARTGDPLSRSLARLTRGWERMVAEALPAAHAQLPCPPNQGVPPCTVSCPGDSQNCKSELEGSVQQTGYVLYDPSCSISGLNCNASVHTCSRSTGARASHSIQLTCRPCTPCSAHGWVENPEYCSNPQDTDHCGCCFRDNSPIVLDLGPHGTPFSDAAGGVLFETDGAGGVRRLAWPLHPVEDPWLVMDRNGNGEIDSLVELFGNFTPLRDGTISHHGYEVLAELDDNQDGWVDRRDPSFNYLQLWRDANRNGISEPDELHPIASTSVRRLSTAFEESARVDEWGNRFKYSAPFSLGAQARRSWDVFVVSAEP